MKRIIQLTDDGSQTINVTETNITYHSTYGAIQESMHVFINAGLKTLLAIILRTLHILSRCI